MARLLFTLLRCFMWQAMVQREWWLVLVLQWRLLGLCLDGSLLWVEGAA
jgi:hypothetical protein